MKKLLFFLTFIAVTGATSVTYAQTVVNPKFGLNTSRLSTDPQLGQINGRLGWQLGLDVRIGNRVYFQPGLYYFKQSSRLITQSKAENDSLPGLRGDLNRQGLQLYTLVGYYLVDGEGFKMRVNAGPSISLLTSVGQSATIGRDDYQGTNVTGVAGVGFDIFFLTLDYNYEWGLSKIFKNDTVSGGNVSFNGTPKLSKHNISVGIKFGF